ncbi:hypothetical protein Bbelb_136330 [Branchiostoma belcheri]|nr:hypothetical protein Bbelb_136330 [Branchiostoma belcheri]
MAVQEKLPARKYADVFVLWFWSLLKGLLPNRGENKNSGVCADVLPHCEYLLVAGSLGCQESQAQTPRRGNRLLSRDPSPQTDKCHFLKYWHSTLAPTQGPVSRWVSTVTCPVYLPPIRGKRQWAFPRSNTPTSPPIQTDLPAPLLDSPLVLTGPTVTVYMEAFPTRPGMFSPGCQNFHINITAEGNILRKSSLDWGQIRVWDRVDDSANKNHPTLVLILAE